MSPDGKWMAFIDNYNVAVPVQQSCPLLFPELRSPLLT
jgi:hypothetical protein